MEIEAAAALGSNQLPSQFISRLHSLTYSIGQYQHTAPHADSQGSVGRDDTIAGSKITPLEREQGSHTPQLKNPGLNDELVDSARSNPAGGVGEQQM